MSHAARCSPPLRDTSTTEQGFPGDVQGSTNSLSSEYQSNIITALHLFNNQYSRQQRHMLISTRVHWRLHFGLSIDSDVLECMECIFQRLQHELHLGHGLEDVSQQLVPVQTLETFVFIIFVLF